MAGFEGGGRGPSSRHPQPCTQKTHPLGARAPSNCIYISFLFPSVLGDRTSCLSQELFQLLTGAVYPSME